MMREGRRTQVRAIKARTDDDTQVKLIELKKIKNALGQEVEFRQRKREFELPK